MTKQFRNYVTKVLKSNGIGENEDFETSYEDFGTLKWADGTMYEDNGDRLCVSDIAFILEESDIERSIKFKRITKMRALSILKYEDLKYEDYCVYARFIKIGNLDTSLRKVKLSENEMSLEIYSASGNGEIYLKVGLIKLLDLEFFLAI